MKILKIEFQNINSLKGSHEIDFTRSPFTASSLFAITGPTGSGKSTILDVISLALFNQVPRLNFGKKGISNSIIENSGAILTKNQKEAKARITYKCKTGIYISEWNLSTAKTGKLRPYEMHIYDASTGQSFDLKKSDVPAKNEELIGLNYDQFIKSVLLAQGEFAQLLRAKKDERGELLEKITGTGIYRKLGIKAFQKKKEVSSEIEKEQHEIEILQKNLLEEEVQKELSEKLAEKTKLCEPLEVEIKKLEKNIQLKKDIRERKSELETVVQKKTAATEALKNFEDQHGEELKKHHKFQLFGEDLRSWRQLHTEVEGLKRDNSAVELRRKDTQAKISGCMDQVRDFIKKNVEEAQIESELHHFSVKVRDLQQQREAKRNTYISLQREFDTEVREVPFQLNGDLETSESKLLELQKVIREDVDRLLPELTKIDLEDSFSEKKRIKQELDLARKAERQSEKIELISGELKKIRDEIEEVQPFLERLPKEMELKKANEATLKEKLEKLRLKKENENLRKTLDQHRQHLKEGEPCPLCGALEHPYAADLPEREDGLQEEIQQTTDQLSAKHREIAGIQTSLDHYQQRYDSLERNVKDKAAELETLKSNFKTDFGELTETKGTDWPILVARLDRQINVLEKYDLENRKLQAIAAGLPILNDLKTVLEEGTQVKEKLEQLYTGKNIDTDCRELQNNWTGLIHQRSSLQSQVKELEEKLVKKTEALRSLEKSLQPKVEKEGCSRIEEALECLLPEQRAAELRRNKESLNNETARIESVEKTLKAQLEQLQKNDLDSTLAKLTEEIQEKRNTLSGWNKECEELRRILQNDQEIRQKILQIEAGLSEKKKRIRRWELLNQLIGDSTGKKFNDFAQDLSLSQLVQLANVRLKDLSDRYRIDKPLGEEDDSLVAIDEHMGGQRRSVKTLSGGETFILSLSMALALSDLASKNVEIDSLFIDEGFGTLDPETLDQTLDTLEKLQAESSKTIGVISHVDSLKERITTQVKLKRNGQGYSSLEVTG